MTAEEQAAEDKRKADEAAAAEAAKKAEDDPDAGKTADEIEAEAKELEEKAKAKKEEEGLSDEEKEAKKKADQIKRRDKAKAKLEDDGNADQPKEIAVDDKVFLGVKDIDPDSETAKVLQKYVDAGIVKDYKSGFDHPGVKGELAAIEADEQAKSVIDENDSEDAKLATVKERVANYRQSGEVPSDAEQQKEIAEANLKEMGLK